MAIVELSFASGEHSLSVRKFSVHESMSNLFRVALEVRSPNEDVDLEAIVGRPALFRVASGVAWAHQGTRVWTGVVSEMELVRVEPDGLSTYELCIVPNFWLLTQRRNYRLFSHASVPEIVTKMLREWDVPHEFRIEKDRYPKLELRIQYGESDHAFIARLLEEAGISYYFEDDVSESRLVFHDRPHTNDKRGGLPLGFVDDPTLAKAAEFDYVTDVRVGNKVRPGKLTIRDFDFRRPGFALFGESPAHGDIESKLEQYHYQPGAFLTEGHKSQAETPAADDRGVARHHHGHGHHLAQKRLEGHRATKQIVRFSSNALDLSPGVVFSMAGHARKDLAEDKELLVNSLTIEGEVDKEWRSSGTASFAAFPFRPAIATPKPKIFGVQSAVVVGPAGQTVHTDEFGRVRVQFHWDREGRFDEHSSVWIRVSQAWAGSGYGMINIPRIGNEVLVSFLDGDPDSPIITGRVFNGAMQVPYRLPEANLMSAWKSDSNSNIILYVDIPDHEGFLEQAERDRLGVVKHDEINIIGNNKTVAVRADEGNVVGGNYARGVMGGYDLIVQKELSLTSQSAVSLTGGMEITQTTGGKWEAGVTPIIPMILTMMGVQIVKGKLDAAFPAGPPDLFAILQAQAAAMGINLQNGQIPPGVSWVAALPADIQGAFQQLMDDFGKAFTDILQPLLDLLSKVSYSDLQTIFAVIAAAPDFQSVVDMLTQLFPPQPGKVSIQDLMADIKAIFDKLMGSIPDIAAPPGASASGQADDGPEKALKKVVMVMKMFSEVMSEIHPGTGITIKPNEIRLTTGKATIELKGEDIEIKAKGNIKIEGASVEISPKPC
ncbi:MAG: type VI secretion system tip protein TssI/VgrG [Polyangiaceae bacterium]